MTTFGEQLRHRREAKGWTRKELAHQISCAVVTIQKLERGERRPSVQMAQQIVAAFGLSEFESAQLLSLARSSTESAIPPLPPAQDLDVLVGRDAELHRIHQMLIDDGTRLLTLTGPGGVGKTRLATAAVNALATHYGKGYATIELATLSHADLIIDLIARRLGLQPQDGAGVMALLINFLRDKQMLLCLDNFEHLLDGAPQLEPLLAACPALTLLVTSRQALGLAQEQVITVQPLALDESGIQKGTAPAILLFAHRARAANADFVLNAANKDVIAELCARVDGLPLAIELMAARSRLMSPETMLKRFVSDQGTPRVDLLAQEQAALPGASSDRHRSLHETLDWSYRLLNPLEKRAFCRFALFQGGCTLAAAEALLPDKDAEASAVLTWDLLSSLLDKHLIVQHDGKPEPRFLMLETVRAYALEQLLATDEMASARRDHAEYYCELIEDLSAKILAGADVERWLDAVEIDHANFRSGLAWSIEKQEGALAARYAIKLRRFWNIRNYWQEGVVWLNQVHALLAESDMVLAPLRARFLRSLGQFCINIGDLTGARPPLKEALSLAQRAEDEEAVALIASSLASLLCSTGELEQAEVYMHQKLAYDQKTGDETDLAITYGMLGEVAMYQENWAEGEAHLRHALTLQTELGDRPSLMITNVNLAHALLEQSRPDEALPYLEDGLAYARAIGNRAGESIALNNLAILLFELEEPQRAYEATRQSLELAVENGLYQALGTLLVTVSDQMLKEGQHEEGVQLLGAVRSAERAGNIEMEQRYEETIERTLESLRAVHGAGAIDRFFRLGATLTLDEAVVLVRLFCEKAI